METQAHKRPQNSVIRSAFTDFRSPLFLRWHGFLNLLIFLSCIALALETVEPFATNHAGLFHWMEMTALLFFSLDYFGNLYYAENRLKYFFSFWGLVDLISILPSFFMLLNLTALRGAKVFRILRVVRVLRVLKIARTTIQQMSAHRGNPIVSNLRIYFIALFSGLMISSTLMYFAEGGHYTADALAHGQAALDAKLAADPASKDLPESDKKFVPTDPISGNPIPTDKQFFTSIPACMWWCIVTLTTTGYGDMYPVTAGGRVIAGATMLLGLVLFGLLMNIIGETLMVMLFGEHTKGESAKPTSASVLKSMFDVGFISGTEYDRLRAIPEAEVRQHLASEKILS